MSIAVQVALVMVVLLVLLLAAGVPIGVGIGLSSAVSMICMLPSNVAFATSAQRIFAGSNSFSLIAIPFFILAGNIMNNGGIALRLVNCAKVIGGRMPGALAQSNVIANMLFGAISGSGAAAAAAIGSTMGPLEEAEGYDKNYSAAVNVASAPVGMLIPPSNTMIVYSTVAGSVSISALFMAGYVPGLGLRRYHPGNHHSKEIRLQRRSKADSQHCIKDFLAGDPKPFNDRYCNRRYSLRCIYRNRRFRSSSCLCNRSFLNLWFY